MTRLFPSSPCSRGPTCLHASCVAQAGRASERCGSGELGDRSENADYQYGMKRLREIDCRTRCLTRQDSLVVFDPRQADLALRKLGLIDNIVGLKKTCSTPR